MESAHVPGRSVAKWAWFAAWVILGAGLALGTLSLGPLLIVPVSCVALVLLSRPTARRSAAGLITGAGVLLLAVAYIQRDGPGTTCWRRGTASGCDEHLDPLPWLIIGLVLVVAGFVVQARRRN